MRAVIDFFNKRRCDGGLWLRWLCVMSGFVAQPRAPHVENLIRRTDDNARETQNLLAFVGKHDARAIPVE